MVSPTYSRGKDQKYKSDSLTGIGGLAMADFRTNPIPIDVFIDPSNPAEYYVDVSDVPNLTPERIATLIKNAAAQVGIMSNNQPIQPSSTVSTMDSEPATTLPVVAPHIDGAEASQQPPKPQ